jgi:hypothetical protein
MCSNPCLLDHHEAADCLLLTNSAAGAEGQAMLGFPDLLVSRFREYLLHAADHPA